MSISVIANPGAVGFGEAADGPLAQLRSANISAGEPGRRIVEVTGARRALMRPWDGPNLGLRQIRSVGW